MLSPPVITVIGSLNYDVVTTYSRLPEAGETILARDFATHNGGKGSNQALACGRLRGSRFSSTASDPIVRMVGCVGADAFGEQVKTALKESGVSVDLVKTCQGSPTGVATILVDAHSGQNRILVFPGANQLIDTADVVSASKLTSTLVLQNEIPVSKVTAAITAAITPTPYSPEPPLIVYNPSPIDKSFSNKLYSYVTCLVLNSTEAKAIVPDRAVRALLTVDDDADQALAAIKPIADTLKLPRYIVITLGAAGCVYYNASNPDKAPVHVPAKKPVNPIVDTTGAGDTFLGALTVQLTQGSSLEQAVDVALSASAIAITRKGAGDSIPYFHEL